MKRALAGRRACRSPSRPAIVFAEIDADTGQLATPHCSGVIHEAFLAGTAPEQACEVHSGGQGLSGVFSKLGHAFSGILR